MPRNRTNVLVRSACSNAFETLEGRQFMSATPASPETHSVHSTPAIVQPKSVKDAAPVAIYVGTLTIDAKKTEKYALTLLTDSNGAATARVGGTALGVIGDAVLTGTHDDAGYKMTVTIGASKVYAAFTTTDGGALSGTLTVVREGKTHTGTFTATKLPPPVVSTNYGKFAGYVTLPTTGQKMLLTVNLTGDSAGHALLTATSPILGNELKLTGSHDGNRYSFASSKGNLALTLSSDKKTVNCALTRTADGQTATMTTSLSSNPTVKDPEPPAPAPAPKTDVTIGKFSGNIVLPGSDRKLASTITLLNTTDGKVVLVLKTPLLATETRFLGDRTANSFVFHDQVGNASFSFALTLSDDQKSLTGTMTRVAEGNVWPIDINFSTSAAPAPAPSNEYEKYFNGQIIVNGQKMNMALKLSVHGDSATLLGSSPILGNSAVTFTGTKSFNSFHFSAKVGNVQLSFAIAISADGSTLAGTLTRVAEGHTMDIDFGVYAVPTVAAKK